MLDPPTVPLPENEYGTPFERSKKSVMTVWVVTDPATVRESVTALYVRPGSPPNLVTLLNWISPLAPAAKSLDIALKISVLVKLVI